MAVLSYLIKKECLTVLLVFARVVLDRAPAPQSLFFILIFFDLGRIPNSDTPGYAPGYTLTHASQAAPNTDDNATTVANYRPGIDKPLETNRGNLSSGKAMKGTATSLFRLILLLLKRLGRT